MKHTPTQLVEIIVQVRSGMLTATEAANRLGISRNTYYRKESKALAAMIAALQPGQPGRPTTTPTPEVTAIIAERDRLKIECSDWEQRLRIHRVMAEADTRSKKK